MDGRLSVYVETWLLGGWGGAKWAWIGGVRGKVGVSRWGRGKVGVARRGREGQSGRG